MKRFIMLIIVLMSVFVGCQEQEVIQNDATNNSLVEKDEFVLKNTQNVPELDLKDKFLEILETDKDGKEYLNLHPDTFVVKYEKVMPEKFEELKNITEYKALYENLPNKELYFVEFTAKGSNLNLQSYIDLEEEKVVSIVGVFIVGMG